MLISRRGDPGHGFGGKLLLFVVLGRSGQVVGSSRLGPELVERGLHDLGDMTGRHVGELVVETVDNGIEVPQGVVQAGNPIFGDVALRSLQTTFCILSLATRYLSAITDVWTGQVNAE